MWIYLSLHTCQSDEISQQQMQFWRFGEGLFSPVVIPTQAVTPVSMLYCLSSMKLAQKYYIEQHCFYCNFWRCAWCYCQEDGALTNSSQAVCICIVQPRRKSIWLGSTSGNWSYAVAPFPSDDAIILNFIGWVHHSKRYSLVRHAYLCKNSFLDMTHQYKENIEFSCLLQCKVDFLSKLALYQIWQFFNTYEIFARNFNLFVTSRQRSEHRKGTKGIPFDQIVSWFDFSHFSRKFYNFKIVSISIVSVWSGPTASLINRTTDSAGEFF